MGSPCRCKGWQAVLVERDEIRETWYTELVVNREWAGETVIDFLDLYILPGIWPENCFVYIVLANNAHTTQVCREREFYARQHGTTTVSCNNLLQSSISAAEQEFPNAVILDAGLRLSLQFLNTNHGMRGSFLRFLHSAKYLWEKTNCSLCLMYQTSSRLSISTTNTSSLQLKV